MGAGGGGVAFILLVLTKIENFQEIQYQKFD
jgi:hypothetical protein